MRMKHIPAPTTITFMPVLGCSPAPLVWPFVWPLVVILSVEMQKKDTPTRVVMESPLVTEGLEYQSCDWIVQLL